MCDVMMCRHKLLFLHTAISVYCKERVAVTQCVRMGRLTVAGNKLLIVVYFRRQSTCKVRQMPTILFICRIEELFINMLVALDLSTCQ